MSMLDAALDYATRLGWPVFPTLPGDKKPLTAHGYLDATTDVEQIKAWWRKTPKANIAIPTGVLFDVIDVEAANTGRFEALCKEHGVNLDSFPRARSGRGGLHVYVAVTGLGSKIPGLGDLKGKGGYVVAPPSRLATTLGGGTYTEIKEPNGALPECPAFLLQLVASTQRTDTGESVDAGQRFTADNPCPICGGHKDMPQGAGIRCWGFRSKDGRYAQCTREEFAGALEVNADGSTYAHFLGKGCKCGQDHQEAQGAFSVTIHRHVAEADEIKPLVLPSFPVEVLPEPAREYVKELAKTGLPLEYLGPTALAVMATAVGGGELEVNPGSWSEPLVLWYGLVGRTGTGKSPSIAQLRRPLNQIEKVWSDDFEVNLAAWKALPRADQKTVSYPVRRRLSVDDYTYESLVRMLAVKENEAGLTVLTDELRGFLRSLGQYKQGAGYDRQKVLELWSASPQTYDRVEGDIHLRVERPILNIVGGVQPTYLQAVLGDDGLKERFCWSWYDQVPPDPSELVPMTKAADRWDALIQGLVNQRARTRMQFAVNATDVFDAARKEYRKRQNAVDTVPHLKDWWSKAPGHLARHALLLALVDVAGAVEERHLGMAGKLIDYFAAHLEALPLQEQNLVAPHERSKDEAVARLVDRLKQAPDRHLTSRDIQKNGIAGVKTALEARYLAERYEAIYPGHTRHEDVTGGRRYDLFAPGYAPKE
jgi:Bifunctional DNA primase/polymerase, N-terminal/Protein of unknown function (DUF3987)